MTAAALARLAQLNAEAADYLESTSPAGAQALRDAARFAACAAKLETKAERAA
jgi:hypothetical protein